MPLSPSDSLIVFVMKQSKQLPLFPTAIRSISLQEDFLVSHFQMLGNKEGHRIPDTLFTSMLELSKRSNLPFLSLKMFLVFLDTNLTRYAHYWLEKSTLSSHSVFHLRRQVACLTEIEFGSSVLGGTHSIPTPTASDGITRKSTNTGGPSRGEQNFLTMKSISLDRWYLKAYGTDLTPEFSELLMGYPPGWTDLNK